jgi:hypothetical protein
VTDEVVLDRPLAIGELEVLGARDAEYVAAAKAANTLRAYRSDWREFATWAADRQLEGAIRPSHGTATDGRRPRGHAAPDHEGPPPPDHLSVRLEE